MAIPSPPQKLKSRYRYRIGCNKAERSPKQVTLRSSLMANRELAENLLRKQLLCRKGASVEESPKTCSIA